MKRSKLFTGVVALSAVGALMLSGCANNGGSSKSGASGSGIVSINGGEPQNPLLPGMTNETNGGKIMDLLYSNLVSYDGEGAVEYEVAESIESDDNVHWTIKIKPDWKFTDGTPVTAESFVKAWNYGAAKDNNQLASYFFEDIKGYSADDNVAEMEGLKVVDDHTFTVELNQPTADFKQRLGYTAYAPLPEAAFKDIEAFGKNPIGNGIYKLEGSIDPSKGVSLVKNEDYKGPREINNNGIDIKFYATQEAAYADVQGGNLDVLDGVPDSEFANYEKDFGDRAVNQPAAIFQSFVVPNTLPGFSGKEGELRRQALSMAIDRKTITDQIFKSTRTPAKDFTSPVIKGWSGNIEGNSVLEYNPEQAKKLWEEANAIAPYTGTLKISYNADGGHQNWVDAVANSIKNTLGADVQGNPVPTFAEFRTAITNRNIDSGFRTGWQADYPGLYNFLGPIYGTGAGSNDADYSNPTFDALIKKGNESADIEEANKHYNQAQEILLKDLPAIPLWYSNVNGVYSDKVSNVTFGWNSVPLYNEIKKG